MQHHIHSNSHSNSLSRYRGYAVQPSAHRLADGYFSSNLLLEGPRAQGAEAPYRFFALDYFPSEEEAIRYSTHWAREWIDTRG